MPHYPNAFKSKLPAVGTTIFTTMSSLASQYNAINLSQGFPDFETSEELVALVNHYMKKGFNQYAPMQGILSLRECLAQKAEELYKISYNPETEITITAGATQAIYTAITTIIREGDEVIVFEPAYDCYVPAIRLAGGIPVFVSLKTPEYSPDWEKIKRVISQKTRMIIINSPHNPAGSILTNADMIELEKIVSDRDICILSDEVYEHIIFDGKKHESVMLYPKLAARSFVVFSFGKTYHTTGWKIGYCFAPANLMYEFRKVHQFVVFCANTAIQYALADYIKNKNYLGLPDFYQEKRDYFIRLIKNSGFKLQPAAGSYFQCVDYSSISKEKDFDFAVRLTKEFGIASIPVSSFYHEGTDHKLLRFCFAKKRETLEKAAERICSVK
jgi:methionine aminotransferase